MNCAAKKIMVQVLIITTCLLMVSLLSIVIHWRMLRANLPDEKHQEICYRQERFYKSADDIDTCPLGLDMGTRNDKVVCCGTLSLVLDNIVTKIMSERYNSDANPDHVLLDLGELNCKKDHEWKQQYMKLVGIIKDKTREKGEENLSSLRWNSLKASDFASGFTYNPDDGTIILKEEGLYFVQSQTKVIVHVNGTENNIDETIKHSIFLIPLGNDKGKVVLESAKTKCEISSEESEITSTLGAAFKLKERDRLFVATSHPKLLAEDDNFFSIQKL